MTPSKYSDNTCKSYDDIGWLPGKPLPSNPYILEFKSGKKQIVFCGIQSLDTITDSQHALFLGIEKKFFETRPQSCLSEHFIYTGQIPYTQHEAILKYGESGLVAMLCDSLKIKCYNGNSSSEEIWKGLTKQYPRNEVLAYLFTKQVLATCSETQLQDSVFIQDVFKRFISTQIIKTAKAELRGIETDIWFYKIGFQRLCGVNWSAQNVMKVLRYETGERFYEVEKAAFKIQDKVLLRQLNWLIGKYDKIFVIYSGWHLLACEDGLADIITKASDS